MDSRESNSVSNSEREVKRMGDTPMSRLKKRIQSYHAKKRDEIQPASAIRLTPDGFTLEEVHLSVTPTAKKHLFQLAKIPTEFFTNRLTPDEQSTVFNRLYGELGDIQMMYRLSGETLYAVVSPKYKPLDNIVLLDIIDQITESGFKLRPVKSYIHPDHTKVRFVPAESQANDLMPMIEFTNSEVGHGSLRIWAGVFRLVCTNGLITEVQSSRARWVHIGKGDVRIPDIAAVLHQATELTEEFNRTQRVYLNAGRKSEILMGLSDALGPRVAEAVVKIANENYHGARNLFELINSVTETAQQYPPSAQTEIEKYAARLLN